LAGSLTKPDRYVSARFLSARHVVTPPGHIPKGPQTGRHRGAFHPQARGDVGGRSLAEARRGGAQRARASHSRRDARADSPPRSLLSRAAQRPCAVRPSRAS
jgi:hypothetical protein